VPDLHSWITQQIDGAFMAALHKAIDATVTGNGTGEPRGFLAMTDTPEPSPADRAFAILAPHLDDVPLYRPPYPRGGVLPGDFGATADRPPAWHEPHRQA
jgi:hypothetical protein